MTQFGIEITVVISVDSRDIAKTTSGKLQRHIVRKRFVKGEFNDVMYRPELREKSLSPVAPAIDQEDSSLEQKIAQIWSKVLGQPVGSHEHSVDFQELGGTSLQAAEIHAELEDALGFAIPHTLLTESRTVEEMRI